MKVKLKVDFVIKEIKFNKETKLLDLIEETTPKGTIFKVCEYDNDGKYILLKNKEKFLRLSLQEFSILTEEI